MSHDCQSLDPAFLGPSSQTEQHDLEFYISSDLDQTRQAGQQSFVNGLDQRQLVCT